MSYSECLGYYDGDGYDGEDLGYDWKTADGQKLLYSEMSDSHIVNAFWSLIKRDLSPDLKMVKEIKSRGLLEAKDLMKAIPDPYAYGGPPDMEYSFGFAEHCRAYDELRSLVLGEQ